LAQAGTFEASFSGGELEHPPEATITAVIKRSLSFTWILVQ
jgi:hypothetical protein